MSGVVLPQSTLGGVNLELGLHACVTYVIADVCVLTTRIVKVKLWKNYIQTITNDGECK